MAEAVKSVEEIADGILELIPDEKSWLKGAMHDPSDRMCTLGAYSKVVFGDPCYLTSLRTCHGDFLWKLRKVIEEQFPGRVNPKNTDYHFIWRFNDQKCTTYEDLRLVLEKVRAG